MVQDNNASNAILVQLQAIATEIARSGSKLADDASVGIDTLLFKDKYLDSLGFIRLLTAVEELRGAPISESQLDLDCFASVRAIAQSYF